MYSVKLYPKKCTLKGCWIYNHTDGEIKDVSDSTYEYHRKHGCMIPIERYIMITADKKTCPTCGHIIMKRKRKVIERFK